MHEADSYYVRFRGRVTGPHAIAELKRMASRGQISRMHEVSPDRATWQRAAETDGLFAAPVTDVLETVEPEPLPSPAQSSNTELAATEVPHTTPSSVRQWFYELDGNEVGPIAEHTLRLMVQGGHLRRDALVWTEGMDDWVPLRHFPMAETAEQIPPPTSMPARRQAEPQPSTPAPSGPFCSACGQQMAQQAIICPKCGSPTPNYSKQPPSGEVSLGAIVASYVAGAIIPLIGWIMAIYLLIKGRPGHAIGVGVLSVFMFWFWLEVGVLP